MAIFNSYVTLPQGIPKRSQTDNPETSIAFHLFFARKAITTWWVSAMGCGASKACNPTSASGKCLREGCSYKQHTSQGHGFCCNLCKMQGDHGPLCERQPHGAGAAVKPAAAAAVNSGGAPKPQALSPRFTSKSAFFIIFPCSFAVLGQLFNFHIWLMIHVIMFPARRHGGFKEPPPKHQSPGFEGGCWW